jgi:hypothetical protein
MNSQRDNPAPEAAPRSSSANGHGSNGSGDVPPTEGFKHAASQVAELREYITYFIGAKVDSLKLTVRNIALYAVLGIVAGVVGLGALITAVVLLLSGLAGAIGAMFKPDRPWAGALIVGFVVVAGTFVAVTLMMKSLTGASRKRTIEKYENRKQDERSKYGRDVQERASEQVRQ